MPREKLGEYRKKRSFDKTPEPGARKAKANADASPDRARFVIQEHHARRLHWDLRLERDGVLASWALPKGVPQHPKDNRLAVRTEDHPLEYLTFHGEIPKGQYGAGTMEIWDAGTYATEKFTDDKVIVDFAGERVQGRYALFATKGDNWMIHRMDPPADAGTVPMPGELKPMMATLSELPADESGWSFEIKWDGVRAIAYCQASHLRLESRTLREITAHYPEVRELAKALGAHEAVLDGEIVAFDAEGRPDFQRLQSRMHLASESAIRRRMADTPVTYVLFDLLYVDGESLCELPYTERRRRLEELVPEGPTWQVPSAHAGDGAKLLGLTRERSLEGIVAKRSDSRYLPGKRTRAWLKIKNTYEQELVIGGWLPGEGRREGMIGALLVGYYEEEGDSLRLRYAGRVGTGFTEGTLRDLARRLEPLARSTSPFEGRQPPKHSNFAEPELVAEVEFREWTHARTLRAPSYKGMRDDKAPEDVRIELAQPPPEGQVEPAVTAPSVPDSAGGVELREGVVEIEGQEVKLSSLDKVLHPESGFTKGDVITYYAQIAPVILPHLRGRPLTLKRYPDGAGAEFSIDDLPTLIRVANLADLELHTSLARIDELDRPTTMVFELDPGDGANILDCARIALEIREMLSDLGVETLVKSSGSKGLHLHVPLNRNVSYEQTGPFAQAVAQLLEKRQPDRVVSRRTRRLRGGKVQVDWSRNAADQSTMCAFSLRAGPRPTVAAPLRWEEIEAAIAQERGDGLLLEAPRLLDELEERAAIFEPLLSLRQRLPKLGG
jgi:bifunctional non-homologous end joining protein LigD